MQCSICQPLTATPALFLADWPIRIHFSKPKFPGGTYQLDAGFGTLLGSQAHIWPSPRGSHEWGQRCQSKPQCFALAWLCRAFRATQKLPSRIPDVGASRYPLERMTLDCFNLSTVLVFWMIRMTTMLKAQLYHGPSKKRTLRPKVNPWKRSSAFLCCMFWSILTSMPWWSWPAWVGLLRMVWGGNKLYCVHLHVHTKRHAHYSKQSVKLHVCNKQRNITISQSMSKPFSDHK